jgi:hypothetical protein
MAGKIPFFEERLKAKEKLEDKFREIYRLIGSDNDYVTLYFEVDGRNFERKGRIVGYDEEYFKLHISASENAIANVPKNFYVDWEYENMFEDIHDNVGEKIGIICRNGKDQTHVGRLENFDTGYLFFQGHGKKPIPIKKETVVDWFSAKELGTVGYFGF